MKGYKTKDILKPGFEMPTDRAGIESVYQTLAKSADERLVRLERYEKEPNFGNATQWAYARAQRDITAWSGEFATRFNTAPPKSTAQLRAKIEDIKTFLRSQTSTKSGIKKSLQKRADTLNREYGTNFTWEDMATFFESKLADGLENKPGSDTFMRSIGFIQKNKDEILQAINDNKTKDIKVPKKMLGAVVRKLLKDNGPAVKDYIESLNKKLGVDNE